MVFAFLKLVSFPRNTLREEETKVNANYRIVEERSGKFLSLIFAIFSSGSLLCELENSENVHFPQKLLCTFHLTCKYSFVTVGESILRNRYFIDHFRHFLNNYEKVDCAFSLLFSFFFFWWHSFVLEIFIFKRDDVPCMQFPLLIFTANHSLTMKDISLFFLQKNITIRKSKAYCCHFTSNIADRGSLRLNF